MERTALTQRQRQAVEADLEPVLVLAGPGAGKTLCLIERVRFLIERHGLEPERICAVTYTNKAADEVAARIRRDLGERADLVHRSTIHSLAVRILRAHGSVLGLERGFAIADEEYQLEILAKRRVHERYRRPMLSRFTAHRLLGHELTEEDARIFEWYQAYLAKRRALDFDDLLLTVGRLFDEHPVVADEVAAQFDCLLVDEFQDLNQAQYRIIRRLGQGHGRVFAVGDDEQSIFSWTGADPRIIEQFANDFGVRTRTVLDQNHRSAREIFEPARKLVSGNPTLFEKVLVASRSTEFPVEAVSLPTDDAETAWLIEDIKADRERSGIAWGDVALLYRRHRIGDGLEGALMRAGIPCRLAQGRALTDEPVIGYLIAALRLIAYPRDPIYSEQFVRLVLPPPLVDRLRAEARQRRVGFMPSIRQTARELANTDPDGRKIRRALAALANLGALADRHATLAGLVDEILSQRVGRYQTALELHADELTDPALDPGVVALADRLDRTLAGRGWILIPPMGGIEIALAGMLNAAGYRLVDYQLPGREAEPDDLVLGPGEAGSFGLALGTFKALQLATTRRTAASAGDFVVLDLETTDKDVETAEIVEVAAARVRDWRIVEELHTLIKPSVAIAAGAARTHGYTMADVEGAPSFGEAWPSIRRFLGDDTVVAHNGNSFDFPILFRMAREAEGEVELSTYDTLPLARSLRVGSAKLELLAERFGVDPGEPHKALSDVRTLAGVFEKLEQEKLARARRVGLANALDYLGMALALSDPQSLGPEAQSLAEITRAHALGRWSGCLDFYAGERPRVGPSAATVDEVIERLGGTALMLRIRADKRAEQRYPSAMARIRRLMEGLPDAGLSEQIDEFLGRVALTKSDGHDADRARVNLLTLHATKGLEFSRVYVVGAEDSEMPGTPSGRGVTEAELLEARRLLYGGMTRARDRLVLTRVEARSGRPTGGHRFLDEMGIVPRRIG
ncbi:MAG: UvrD-helicase domain-containing protein [Gemmatimonadales bacterium]